ncbi:PTS system trehalose-specific EIIBC component [Aerococcus sanguinicola]|uniref:PTS system trehalose-specific EIIBC component n=1 Tax=Aerococcus sanguinicola TaxID=119206 RepID=UPI0025506145|nr:PTS system trehalose-specific EIIBC component [Aerococcus sanguinicola]MDK7050577.1 PTS system trehalose-specific EIIBC component [Aerococcus sanguinicola]
MADFKEDAAVLVEAIGGRENVAAVTHCATRMRFALEDPGKADVERIESLPSVKGTFTQAGQFQVIIGNQVSEFYQAFEAVSGLEGTSKDQVKDQAKGNQSAFQRALSFMAEVFAPIIPAFIVGGLILGFRNLLSGIPLDMLDGQTLVEASTFWAGLDDFLWLPSEAIFHFLPVGITWSVVKKMGGTQILGIILGITLVSGQLLNAYDAPAAILNGEVPVWDFGFFTLDKIGYQGQVLPALFAGLTLGYLERFFRKHVPEYLSMILVPFLALFPSIILAHTVLGPVGWRIGTWIGSIVYAGLTSGLSWLFGAVFGALYAPLVVTGLHHMSNAVDAQLIADYQGTGLWPMIALSNIAQGSAVLAVWWMTRHDEEESQVTIPAAISAYLGVTEPALFGINLKYMYPLVAGMIGSSLAGLLSTATKVTANSIGIGGLPGFLVIQVPSMAWFFLAMLIALVVPFALTILFKKTGFLVKDSSGQKVSAKQDASEQASQAAPTSAKAEASKERVASVANGKAKAITEVADEVFSQKMMGDGFAVEPTDGRVVSPITGQVTSVFPTKHAIGLETDSGVEVLTHMGLDTVDLEGEPFTIKVQVGNPVDIGTELAEMDLEDIRAAGKGTDIVVVFTEADQYDQLDFDFDQADQAGQGLGYIVKK